MGYVWQTADFLTGVTSPDRVLPHVPGTGTYTHDIKASQTSSVKIHKDLLGANGAWRSKLKVIDTMLILHDEDKAWNDPDAILTGGFINALPADYGNTLEVTVGGVNEWWRMHIVCSVYNGTIIDPNATYLFKGSNMQNTLHSIIKDAHSPAGIPAGVTRTPPQILNIIDGTEDFPPTLISKEEDQTFPENTIEVQPANYRNYADVIEEARDVASQFGNEVMPKLVWLNSSKTLVGVNVKIGTDTQPHINFNQTKTIYLERDGDIQGYLDGNKDYHIISMQLNQNRDGYANRIIAQSNAGGAEEDADLTTKIINAGPEVLVDTTYNPNVKLEQSVLNAHMSQHLTAATRYPLTGTITLIGDPAEWNNHLGKKLFIVENTDDDNDFMNGFGKNEELRISDIKVTPTDNANEAKIVVGFVIPAPRYPRLPREYNPDDPFNTGGGGGTSTRKPVVVGRPKNAPNLYDPTLGGGGNTGGSGDGTGTSWGGGKTAPDGPDDSKLATGYRHTMAIASDGSLYGWGWNEYAQLGLGFQGYSTASPTKVGTDKDWKKVWCVWNTTFALKNDNSLWAWGQNPIGAPRYPEDKFAEATFGNPVKVADNVKTLYAKAFNHNSLHIIKLDGTLWAAGRGYNTANDMSLGFSDGLDREEFAQIGTKTDWIKIEGTPENSSIMAALDAAGMIWTWGYNAGTLSPTPMYDQYAENPVFFSDIAICYSSGSFGYSAIGLQKETNTIYTWGYGYHQGDSIITTRTLPLPYEGPITQAHSLVPCDPTNRRPYNLNMFVSIEGTLCLFGPGYPFGVATDTPIPVNIAMGSNTDWRQPFITRSNNYHFLAVTNNGELWGAGWNYDGQLGNGTASSITNQLNKLSVVSGWKRITISQVGDYDQSLAVLNDNMYATGRNNVGQLGLGSKTEIGAVTEDTTDRYTWTIQPSSGSGQG